MRQLDSVITTPTATPDGRVLFRPGYDEATRVYVHLPHDYVSRVPDKPSRADLVAAFGVMSKPWRSYRFSTPHDAAGLFSGILAAVCRPVLDISPAYQIDASQPGVGKTILAQSLGALAVGERPAVTPFSGSTSDDELRKRLIAGAIDQSGFQCLDNITGCLKSPVLASLLTSGKLSDRILGQSRNVTVRDRSLFLMTANNASLWADLQRRVVQIRLEGGERPTHRAFAFCPITEALAQRQQIAEAACTLWRAYFNAGAPDVVAGDVGGFRSWNRLCRQPILWAVAEGLTVGLPWQLGDPAFSMLADPADSDPEVEALGDILRTLWAMSEGKDFTANMALGWFAAGAHDAESCAGEFRSAVLECVGLGKVDLSARSLGRVFLNRRDRVVGGLKLLSRSAIGPMKQWRIVQTKG